jgi:hypothetical protein
MICPSCGSEYRDGYTRCADCEIELIEPQPPAAPPEVTLVKVYETGNAAIVPLLESVFDDAGIEYMTKGEGIQELFGFGRFGTGLNYVTGPVEFHVRKDDESAARRLIETLDAAPVAARDSDADEP